MSSIPTTALNGNWVTGRALHPAGLRARRQRRPPGGSPSARRRGSGFPPASCGPPGSHRCSSSAVRPQSSQPARGERKGRGGGSRVAGRGAEARANCGQPSAHPSPVTVAASAPTDGRASPPAFRAAASSGHEWSSAAPGNSSCFRARFWRAGSAAQPALPGLTALLVRGTYPRRVVVLASGDPLLYGIGSTLVRLLGADHVTVLPHPSSVSLAAARLGWSLDDLEVITTVGRPLAMVHPALQPGRRLLVLVSEPTAAADIRQLVCDRGFGASRLTVLADLGGPDDPSTRPATSETVPAPTAVWRSSRSSVLPIPPRHCSLGRPGFRTRRTTAAWEAASGATASSPNMRSAPSSWPRSDRSPDSCCGMWGPDLEVSASSGCGCIRPAGPSRSSPRATAVNASPQCHGAGRPRA